MNPRDEFTSNGESLTPPPPSAALLAAVGAMTGVSTRVPLKAFAAVLSLALLILGVKLVFSPLRSDLSHLPLPWLISMGALWFAAFLGPLTSALIPPRGHVAPRPVRAGTTSFIAMGVLLVLALVFNEPAAQSHDVLNQPVALWKGAVSCALHLLLIMALPLLVALWSLRRVITVRGGTIGAALGTATGALGGFVLHWLCSNTHTLHIVLGHVGGTALAAGLGALAGWRWLR